MYIHIQMAIDVLLIGASLLAAVSDAYVLPIAVQRARTYV